jgi:hypothetical protein
MKICPRFLDVIQNAVEGKWELPKARPLQTSAPGSGVPDPIVAVAACCSASDTGSSCNWVVLSRSLPRRSGRSSVGASSSAKRPSPNWRSRCIARGGKFAGGNGRAPLPKLFKPVVILAPASAHPRRKLPAARFGKLFTSRDANRSGAALGLAPQGNSEGSAARSSELSPAQLLRSKVAHT